jgi:5-methylcytosine-specific restriction endonuclease McrA
VRKPDRRVRRSLFRFTTGRRKRNLTWFAKYGPVKEVPCCYCKKPLTFNESTLEHLVPTALGGPDALSNWDISCYKCNQREGKKVCKLLGARNKAANHPGISTIIPLVNL